MNKEGMFQLRLNKSLTHFSRNIAIEYGSEVITYAEMNARAIAVAQGMADHDIPPGTFVAILSQDKVNLIATMVGIIKAGAVFIPMDVDNPENRMVIMIKSAGIKTIFCDRLNYHRLASNDSLKNQGLKLLLIDDILSREGKESEVNRNYQNRRSPGDQAYVYFTSGTTGAPKGIIGKGKSLLHYCDWERDMFKVNEDLRISQLATTSDAFLKEVFVTLLNGATLSIPENLKEILSSQKLINWVEQAGINILHCVPHLFRLLSSDQLVETNFPRLKYVIMSGERVFPADLLNWYQKIDERVQLVNLYGTTETTILNTYYFIDKSDCHRKRIPIGKAMKGNRLIILDDDMKICNKNAAGEIYIRTPYRTWGYCNSPELTNQRFIPNPFNNDPKDLIYKTGDRGRMMDDGNFELLGRIDRQVKIRGHRFELEEVENVLATHGGVKEAVVVKKEISENNELLFAYILEKKPDLSGEASGENILMDYLSARLPDYMLPVYIIKMEEFPRKPNRKIDYDQLPDPLALKQTNYIAPRNSIEKVLAQIWSEILGVEKVSIDDSFWELGGNSLNLMNLVFQVYEHFNVEVTLEDIFLLTTIRKQAEMIKEMGISKESLQPIASTEEKEYYPLSSAQRRLYIYQQMYGESTAYNMSQVVLVEGIPDFPRVEVTFKKILEKNESFRTSFKLVKNEPVQKIHRRVEFRIEPEENGTENREVETIIKNFVKPFQLDNAPLFRAGLVQRGENKYLLILDSHHLITDGMSQGIFIKQFMNIYAGEEASTLNTRYRDYVEWQNNEARKKRIKKQEDYWLKTFSGKIPALDLPLDHQRPQVHNFAGKAIKFEIGEKVTRGLKELASRNETTLFNVLLSVCNILLAKITGQEDIIVGVPTSGRNHPDLQEIMGMFVNTVVLRNFITEERTFIRVLQETKLRTLEAFENQDYPFEKLVEQIAGERDYNRNPLFDVMFQLQNFSSAELKISGLKVEPRPINEISDFDLCFSIDEREEILLFTLVYNVRLIKEETGEAIKNVFLKILSSVIRQENQKIQDIHCLDREEEERIISKIRLDRENLAIEFDI